MLWKNVSASTQLESLHVRYYLTLRKLPKFAKCSHGLGLFGLDFNGLISSVLFLITPFERGIGSLPPPHAPRILYNFEDLLILFHDKTSMFKPYEAQELGKCPN